MTLKIPVDQIDTSVLCSVCLLVSECDIKEAKLYPACIQDYNQPLSPHSPHLPSVSVTVLVCWDPGLYTVRHRHKIETGTDWKMAACTQSPTRLSLSSSCWLLLTITLRFLLKSDPGLSVDSVANNLELSN